MGWAWASFSRLLVELSAFLKTLVGLDVSKRSMFMLKIGNWLGLSLVFWALALEPGLNIRALEKGLTWICFDPAGPPAPWTPYTHIALEAHSLKITRVLGPESLGGKMRWIRKNGKKKLYWSSLESPSTIIQSMWFLGLCIPLHILYLITHRWEWDTYYTESMNKSDFRAFKAQASQL